MATDKVKAPTAQRPGQFGWGETVRFRGDVKMPLRAGAIAEVCGIAVIETAEHANAVLGGSIGMEAYLIEFMDGQSVEVVGDLLVKHCDSDE